MTKPEAPNYRTDEDGTCWRVWTDAERAQHRAENEDTERWLDQHRAHRMPGDFEARKAANAERNAEPYCSCHTSYAAHDASINLDDDWDLRRYDDIAQ